MSGWRDQIVVRTHGSDPFDDPMASSSYLAHRNDPDAGPIMTMEEPAFLAALGDIRGKHVADLGCGDGSTAAVLMGRGADRYLGIDRSARMFEAATRNQASDRVEFVEVDIEDADLGRAAFDLVVSRMALHYVDRLDTVLARVNAALRPAGRIVMTVVHPVLSSPEHAPSGRRTNWSVDDYFVRGPRHRAWFGSSVTWHHRTVADHVRLLTSHGFRIDTIDECEPVASLFDGRLDELARRRRVPLVLLIAAGVDG